MAKRTRQRTLAAKHLRTRKLFTERLEARHFMAADLLSEALLSDLGALDEIEFVSNELAVATSGDGAELPDEDSLDAYIDAMVNDVSVFLNEATAKNDITPVTDPRNNDSNALDVNGSGGLSVLDALLVVNHLNYGDPSLTTASDVSAPGVFYTDVNGDGVISDADALDVLDVLQRLSQPVALRAEAEPMLLAPPPGGIPVGDRTQAFITEAEVETLLARAAGATNTDGAIIVIVDRGGVILGVRVEQGAIVGDQAKQIFAIDGAVAKARTAAFFANNEAPLTSRTIRSLSQTTILEREVESNPTVPVGQNPFDGSNLALARTFGPGVVAPVGLGGHFPPGVKNTPPVDLFNIELQSRDGLEHAGANGFKETDGTPGEDDIQLLNRFNVPTAFLPVINGMTYDVPTPESYGVQSSRDDNAQGRGIATMPGGIPLYKDIDGNGPGFPFMVGGIGVFFPGPDHPGLTRPDGSMFGDATFEQGFLPNVKQTAEQRLNSAKALEAEYIAIAAAGGIPKQPSIPAGRVVGPIDGIAAPPGYTLPFGRIDLVGLTLEVFGPNPTTKNKLPGIDTVFQRGRALPPVPGGSNSGTNQTILGADMFLNGTPVPDGWLVLPHNSNVDNITAADVIGIVNRSIAEANLTRAAIRLNLAKNPPSAGPRAKMVIAVADSAGNILGLFRMLDATIFSIDVAVAKARNTAYYADPADLQNVDKVDDDLLVARGTVTVAQLNKLKYKNNNGAQGTPDLFTDIKSKNLYNSNQGTALTNRTFRFLAEPRYPSGVDGTLPPVFSILTDPGINRKTAENLSQASPTLASQFQSVMGFDAFHPSRNFRDPGDVIIAALGVNTNSLANQNGIVFFPGSTPLYKGQILVGGFGISGDGVDQDDVVTFAGQTGLAPPQNRRADTLFYRGVRLPFQKFNRNPRG